jgi:CRP-like cAMP-binding protein
VCRDGVRIELPLTHEILAQMVRSSRETVTSALTVLRRDGILARDREGYRLTLNPALLEPDGLNGS